MKAADLEKKLGKKKHKTTSELKQVVSTRSDQNPNFCLFLGSGASRNSGIRTAGEMAREWRAKVYQDLKAVTENSSVEQMRQWLSENASDWYDETREYASLIERIYPLPANRRKFIETEVADKIPSIGYAYLEPVPKVFDSILARVLQHKSGEIAAKRQSTSRKSQLMRGSRFIF